MKEYIVYSLAVFLPLGALMSLLLRKQGLLYKHITIIVGFSLMVIISFPLAIKTMGWMFSLFFYVAVLCVLIWYLLNGPEGAEMQVYSEEIVLDLSAIKDPTMKEIKTVQGMLDESQYGNSAEKVGDRLVRMGTGLFKPAEFQQDEFDFAEDEIYDEGPIFGQKAPDREPQYRETPADTPAPNAERSYLDKWVDHQMDHEPDKFPAEIPRRPVLYKEEPVVVGYEPEWLPRPPVEPVFEPEPELKAELEPEQELEPALEPELERALERKHEFESAIRSEPEPAEEAGLAIEPEPAHEPEVVPETVRLFATEPEPEPALESEPELEPEAQPEFEAEYRWEGEQQAATVPEPAPSAGVIYEAASDDWDAASSPEESLAPVDSQEQMALKKQLDFNIDQGFAAKFAGGWAAAAYHFEEALDMAADPELRYLVVNELAYIYREEGFYQRSLELLQAYLEQESPGAAEVAEIRYQIRYFSLLADELERFGKPRLPYAMVPRLIRMNVDSAM